MCIQQQHLEIRCKYFQTSNENNIYHSKHFPLKEFVNNAFNDSYPDSVNQDSAVIIWKRIPFVARIFTMYFEL